MPINRGRTLDELIEWLEECAGPDGLMIYMDMTH